MPFQRRTDSVNKRSFMVEIESSFSSQKHIVILVHGTFARSAAWTRKGKLYSALKTHLPGSIILSYDWSGWNSNASRLKAAKGLTRLLRELRLKNPGQRIVVIGHSHAGNVILSALKTDGALADAVVCLATPFLQFAPRDLDFYEETLYSVFLGWIACILLLIYSIATARMLGHDVALLLGESIIFPKWLHFIQDWVQLDGPSSWMRWGFFLPLRFLSLGGALLVMSKITQQLFDNTAHLDRRLQLRQERAIRLLSLPSTHEIDLLAIRVRGDEARRVLGFVDIFLEVPTQIFRQVEIVVLAFAFFAALAFIFKDWIEAVVGVLAGLIGLIRSGTQGFLAGFITGPLLTNIVLGYGMSGWLILTTSYLLLQVAMLLSGRLASIAFGESFYYPFLVRTSVSPEPTVANVTTAEYSVAATAFREFLTGVLPLRHSSVYKSDQVIREIIQWILARPPCACR
jgi:pimeloyl-ACP methyl ester carboxylesterase